MMTVKFEGRTHYAESSDSDKDEGMSIVMLIRLKKRLRDP